MLLQRSSSNEFYDQYKNGHSIEWNGFSFEYMTCLIKYYAHKLISSGDNSHFSSNP